MTSLQRPDNLLLSAWLDDELDPVNHAAVDAWLREHPEDAALTRLWAADRETLRARFDAVLDEPIPPALLQTVQGHSREPAGAATGIGASPTPGSAARTTDQTTAQTGARPFTQASPAAAGNTTGTTGWRGWRLAAAMAGLIVGGGVVGGLIGATAAARDPSILATLRLPWSGNAAFVAAANTPNWPRRAAVAHAVYAPEVRHPVEVNVAEGSAAEQRAQEQHLARWLSKRLDLPVRLYDLRPQGFELVGGRLLPDSSGPSAQLMYQNGNGQRITLYLRRPEPGTATDFRFQRDGDLNLFYWVEDGFGCALVGKLPRAQLLTLAEAVYKQAETAGLPATAPPRPGS